MRKLVLVALMFFAGNVFGNVNPLVGAYVGCGNSAVLGPRQVIFHIVEMPLSIEENDVQLSAAFTWFEAPSSIMFPKVEVSEDRSRLVMRTEIRPVKDFGTIINTVTVRVNSDGSLYGIYQTNSMTPSGQLLSGTWTARKVLGDVIPKINCQNTR